MNQERIEAFLRLFPPVAELQEMEPEELGPFVLNYLKKDGAQLNRYNFSLSLPNGHIAERFMEAWGWLETEGFLAAKPGAQGDWVFITRKGMNIVDAEDFDAYKQAAIFPHDLDPVLMRTVKPLFLRGDYDTAVFRAFKEVEVRVRKKGNLGKEYFGRGLMQKAFGPGGPLEGDEKDAMRELFAGAISFCKNPSSHQEVQFENPREVVNMIGFADLLLKVIGRLPSAKLKASS
jgi:uncharacterized protein (TIGR02391 family)